MSDGQLSYEGLNLPASLQPGNETWAVDLLKFYFFDEVSPGRPLFSGGQWDAWDPSGTRASSQNTFTSDDLTSLSLLGVNLPGDAAVQILVKQKDRFDQLLSAIGDDLDLVDVDDVSESGKKYGPVWALWHELRKLHNVGATKTAKLIARKRPRLVPVYDSVLKETVFPSGKQWQPLHAALRQETPHRRLHDRLEDLRQDAGLGSEVSPLRLFDVLAWLEGSGKAKAVPRP
ncbi:DUF6308 family protein [Yimella sp. NH-Cas1]|uniref:DUF6308 family protein n=1 Tax=Yimella sp. NH-Cas1 TaxID=2917726 RepID=UPI001EFA6B6D|nr:DUF6308 family protein [Yimella sp. NH-Cas1]MCG8654865.1 DUF6308 family protein [Yimella sp. NH-Cas1]